MKKIILTFAAIIVSAGIYSQTANKYVLLEHFTNDGCGPCATHNPIFKANILDKNKGNFHHITYHTSWPDGSDPMYTYNSSDIGTRTTFYSVTGVPTMQLLGKTWSGQPGSVTLDMIDSYASEGSPISIRVEQVKSTTSDTFNITVTVFTVGTPPTGSLKLRVAVVEKELNYTTAPGSNGEKYFPNVFRKMLPNINGITYTPASQGDSVTFKYSYKKDPIFVEANMFAVAFVQDVSTKKVLNSGSNLDSKGSISASSSIKDGEYSNQTTFDATLKNEDAGNVDYNIKFSSDAPSDWTVSYIIGGTTYTDTSLNLSFNQYESKQFTLNVTPGYSPYFAKFTLSISSSAFPNNLPMTKTFYSVSGISDLIVNNTDETYTQYFKSGLNYANNKSYASVGKGMLIKGYNEGQLKDILYIYFNVGYSAQSLTDELVNHFKNTLFPNGGRLFLSGQDIGWETWDTQNGTGTTTTKDFYTNYMSAAYVKDNHLASTVSVNTADELYNNIGSSGIDSTYGDAFYLDLIKPVNIGKSILFYGGDTSKVAGVRSFIWDGTANRKVVYLGLGLEMIKDSLIRNEIIKTTHNWFHELTSVEEFDNKMKMLFVGQNYPNPSNQFTEIQLSENVLSNSILMLYDLSGRVVMVHPVAAKSDKILLNTAHLKSGHYVYNLVDEKGSVHQSKKMEVIH